MTEIGAKLEEIAKLASQTEIDLPKLLMLVSEAILLERGRCRRVLEALRKEGETDVAYDVGWNASLRAALEKVRCLDLVKVS